MPKIRDKIVRIAFGDVLGRGLGFVTTIYLARTLGAEAYGLITIALSWLGYFLWAGDLGLLNLGPREIAKEPEKRLFRAKEIFILKVFLGLGVLVLALLIVPVLKIPEDQKTIILGFSYSLIPYSLLLEWYYNGKQFFGKVALSKIVNGAVYLVLVLLIIRSKNDISLIPMLYTAGVCASALVLGTFALIKNPFTLPARGMHLFKDLLKSAYQIGTGTFFSQIIILLPPITIGWFLSSTDAGIYGAAMRVIMILMMIDRIFVNLLLPNLSAQWTNNKELAKENLNVVFRIMLVFGMMATLFLAVSAEDVIQLIYGSEYESAAIVLVMLSLYLFGTFQNSIFSFGLVAIDKDREFFRSKLIGGIVAAALIILSAKTNNLLLVALSVSLSELIFTFFSVFWFNKTIQIKYYGPFISTLIFGTGIYYLSTFIHIQPVLKGILAVIALFGGLFAVGVITSEQIQWFRKKVMQ